MSNFYENLAYVPLDIGKIDFSYEELRSLMDTHQLPHHPYPDLWNALAFSGRIDNFADPKECDDAWNKRYDKSPGVKINPAFPKKIADALLHLLDQMPYELCTFTQILSQRVDVPPHKDGLYQRRHSVRKALREEPAGFQTEPEPAGLKIMLSHTQVKSFYVCESLRSPKQYIELPPTTNCFACNERRFFHGATAPQEPKFILSTFGIIDRDKHTKLIDRSMEKYSDNVIRF